MVLYDLPLTLLSLDPEARLLPWSAIHRTVARCLQNDQSVIIISYHHVYLLSVNLTVRWSNRNEDNQLFWIILSNSLTWPTLWIYTCNFLCQYPSIWEKKPRLLKLNNAKLIYSLNWPFKPVGWSVTWPVVSWGVSQSVSQSVRQSVNQSVGQSVGHLVCLSVYLSVGQSVSQ